MNFNAMVENFMPYVNGGADIPILINRNKTGDWYAQEVEKETGGAYDIVKNAKENDPYAITVKGSDFARGSFPYVYDKILNARLRAEYNTLQNDTEAFLEIGAVANFLEDNLCELSPEVAEYMTTLNKPLYTMNEIKPFALYSNSPEYGYNEDRADEYISLIESHVEKCLHGRTADVVLNDNEKLFTVNPDDYTVLQSQQINNRLVTLSENPQAEYRYMVCEYWTNPQGVKENTETGVTNDHLEALERYTGRVHYYVSCAVSERDSFKRSESLEFTEPMVELGTLNADDKFFIRNNGSVEQLYYNADGCEGKGQYVSNIIYHHDILSAAIEAGGSTEIFFNAIAENARQYLTDNNGNEEFNAEEKRFNGNDHNMTGCTAETMDNLIKFAKEFDKEFSKKPRSTDKKPSLSERIEKGKEKVREADKNRTKSDKPKNHNKGVDD